MRYQPVLRVCTLPLVLAGLASVAVSQTGTVAVGAVCNIFAAGRTSTAGFSWACSGSGGLPAVVVPLATGTKTVTFPSVTGTVSCCGGAAGTNHPPDGGQGPFQFTRINSFASIGGVRHASRIMFLMGVFVDDNVPTGTAPDPWDVTEAESIVTFAPRLRASFYIGDGHASGAGGTLQEFAVPCGATRLCLGFADALDFGNPSTPGQTGNPGCYLDNVGSLSCSYSFSTQGISNPVFGTFLCPGTGDPIGTFIVSIVPPTQGNSSSLSVAVSNGRPNSTGLVVGSTAQESFCVNGVCLCVGFISGFGIPVTVDATGLAVFRFPLPPCSAYPDFYFQFIGFGSVPSPFLGTTRALRITPW